MIAALALLLVPVAAKIQFLATDQPTKVVAVGDFCDWKLPGLKLTLGDDGRTWQGAFQMDPGVYRYAVLENDQNLPTGDDLKSSEQTLVITPPEYSKRPGELDDGLITASALRHRPDKDVTRVNDRTFLVAITRT